MRNLIKQVSWLKDFSKSAYGLFKQPEDFRSLLKLGDVIAETNWFVMATKKFREQDQFQLMQKKYSPTIPSLENLKKYPKNSLGFQFAEFMVGNHLTTYDFEVPVTGDAVWLRERSRRVHDFLHVLLEKGISVEDEICLNAYLVYSIQAPISCLIMYGGLFRLMLTDFRTFLSTRKEILKIKQWSQANPCLLTLPIEEMLDTDTSKLRQTIGLPA